MRSLQNDPKDFYASGVIYRVMQLQYNDLEMRLHMMRSVGLKELPQIDPNAVDRLSGIISRVAPSLSKFDFEEMLYNDRHSTLL